MGSPINVGGQYLFITFFTPPRLSGKFLLFLQGKLYSNKNQSNAQYPENPYAPETLQNDTTMHDKDNFIHNEYDTSEMKIQLKLKHWNTMGRKFMKQKSQYLWKHLKFLLYSTKQYIMKMIQQMTNL